MDGFDYLGLDMFAQLFGNPRGDGNQGPRPPVTLTTLATVDAVNPSGAEVRLTKGGKYIDAPVRFIQAITPDYPLRKGERVAMQVTGSGIFVIGRHVDLGYKPSVTLT